MALAYVSAACSAPIVSPPASPIVLESAQRMPDNGIAARGMVGTYGGIFSGGARTATLGVRLGLPNEVETAFDASAYRVSDNDSADVSPNVSRWVGGARVSASWGKLSTSFFRPILGFGGGYSAGGGFVSPDLGFTLAYENQYFVPFLQARGGLSLPIKPNTIELKIDGETRTGRPETTYMAMVTLGGEEPLSNAEYAPALAFGLSYVRLVDRHDDLAWWGASLGLEIPLWDDAP